MRRKQFSEDQIVRILEEFEQGKSVEELCREYNVARSTIYMWRKKYGGIEAALPKAIQIADRWHLLFNLRERIQRTLPSVLKMKPKIEEKEKSLSPASRRRKKMYDLVRYLYAKGYSRRAIARALDLSRGTVKHYIQSETFPDYLWGVPRPSKID